MMYVNIVPLTILSMDIEGETAISRKISKIMWSLKGLLYIFVNGITCLCVKISKT